VKKSIGSILVTALGLLLLVYSGARSMDFIALTLPPGQQILAVFGLFALDGGIIFWLLNFLGGARGQQRAIALIMIVIDFIGAVTMFTLDTLYNTGQAGLVETMKPGDIQAAVIGLSVIIALNVGGTILHHLLDPDNLHNMAEEDAKDLIEALTVKEIIANAHQLASEIAPERGAAWKKEQLANYRQLASGRTKKQATLPETTMVINAAETVLPEKQTSLPEKSALLENPTKPASTRRRVKKTL
jgi:hypothetical protein